MKNKIRLQTRLLVSVGLVVVAVLLSTSWFVSLVQEQKFEAEEFKRMYLRSEAITRRMGHLMYSSNWRYMMIALSADMKNDTSMLYFYITSPSGEILLCDDRSRVGTFEPLRVPLMKPEVEPVFTDIFYSGNGNGSMNFKVYRTRLKKDAFFQSMLREQAGEMVFDTFWNIQYMGNDLGILRMGFSRKELSAKLVTVNVSILSCGLLVLIVILAMIALVVKQSMVPLEEFTQTIVQIQANPGDGSIRERLAGISFDRIPVSTLEMENLKLAFDSLREMVALTWNELDRHHDNLEAMVLDRTAELKAANLELERRMIERKEIEDRLVNAQKLESVGVLAGGVAHDFNNLLMGILGNASLIEQRTDPFDYNNKKAKKIVELVKTGAEVVQQLLGFARGGKYAPESLNINELLGMNLKMFGRTRKDLEIKCKYQEKIWMVKADKSQMGQVMLNLFLNASEAMPEKGLLWVKTKNIILDDRTVEAHGLKPGHFVEVSIIDNGEGMAEEIRTRVFDPFFTTKQMGRGTGLGLASVYGIVKNHDGFVTVRSTLGRGSVFSVFLPASNIFPIIDPTIKPIVETIFEEKN